MPWTEPGSRRGGLAPAGANAEAGVVEFAAAHGPHPADDFAFLLGKVAGEPIFKQRRHGQGQAPHFVASEAGAGSI